MAVLDTLKRRGPVVGLVGAAITAGSFLALLSVTADLDAITVNGEMASVRSLLDGVFTDVTDEVLVFAGDTAEFRHVPYGGGIPPAGDSDQPLLWAVEIADYEEGDAFTVSASDDLGASTYGPRYSENSVMFDTIAVPDAGELVFSVRNDGGRPFSAVMMFVDDPSSVDILGDPDSKLVAALVPLAASGLAMLAGMTVMAAGAVVTLVDWRKTRGRDGAYDGDWRERR